MSEKEKKENFSEEELDEEESEKDSDDEEEEEDLEKVVQEEDYYENMALNRFLSNPWKQVSLDERNVSPISNLEEDLPEKREEEKDLDQEKIEYELFKGVEDGKYQSLSINEDFKRENILSEQEKNLDKMKRLYDNPKKLSSEFEERNSNPMKYVKPEDTKRTDYLLRKKFGDD